MSNVQEKKVILVANDKNNNLEKLENVWNTIKKDKFLKDFGEVKKIDFDKFIRQERNKIKKPEEKNYSLMIFYISNTELKDVKEVLSNLREDDFSIPVFIFTDELTASFVKDVYISGYPHIGGIFNIKKFTDEKFDYEDMANFLDAVKYLLRERYTLEEEKECKEIRWKIKRDDEDAFISLFVDRKMQRFMREINFRFCQIARQFKEEVREPEKVRAEINNFFQKFKEIKNIKDYLNEIERIKNEEYPKNKENRKIFFKPPSTSLPVILIEGETGTGKTLITEWFRHLSEEVIEGLRFETISIVTFNKEEIERELFGEVGVSVVPYPGKFLSNFGGIIFLDEVGELSLEYQSKLLLTIETGKVHVKGLHGIDIYTRVIIILATCRNIEKMVEEGKFLESLYHRILYRFKLPSIKERAPDLRVLVDYVLQDPYVNPCLKVKKITTRALIKLEEYDYKGNFREIRNILTRAVEKAVLRGDDKILAQDIEF